VPTEERQDMTHILEKPEEHRMNTCYKNAIQYAEDGLLFPTMEAIKEADALADKLGIQRQDMTRARECVRELLGRMRECVRVFELQCCKENNDH